MGRPTKKYQAFTSLIDQLFKVPKAQIVRRVEAGKAASALYPRNAASRSSGLPLAAFLSTKALDLRPLRHRQPVVGQALVVVTAGSESPEQRAMCR
jgi:hypothetical protein